MYNFLAPQTGWLFIDWLSSVTEQINETMHYQLNGRSNTLTFRIPTMFFDCLQERIALTTSNINTENRKFRMPNITQEIERKDVPPLGIFIKYTWNIYNILHVKSIFDTNIVSVLKNAYFLFTYLIIYFFFSRRLWNYNEIFFKKHQQLLKLKNKI